MKKFLIFPAIHIGSMELYYSLKSLEKLDVLVILKKEFYEKFKPEIKNIIIDNYEDSGSLNMNIEQWLKKNNAELCGILAIDDDDQFIISKNIAQYFNLEFYSEDTLKISSNKFLMKEAFKKNNVPSGKHILLSEPDDSRIDKVGFPNVLKLIQSSGSEYIFKNENKKQLNENFNFLKEKIKEIKNDSWFNKTEFNEWNLNPKEEFLLEEYLEGDEYSCDFMIAHGKVSIIRIVKKYPASYFGYFAGFYLLNETTSKKEGLDELKDVCKAIASALEINKAVCMVDFKKTKTGIKIIETSIRPGLSTFIHLMYKLWGYTSLQVLAKLRLGMIDSIDINEQEGIIVHLFADKPGKITTFDTSSIHKMTDLIEIKEYNKVGDIITQSKIDHWDYLMGYVLLKNPYEIQKLFKRIKQEFCIDTDEQP